MNGPFQKVVCTLAISGQRTPRGRSKSVVPHNSVAQNDILAHEIPECICFLNTQCLDTKYISSKDFFIFALNIVA